MKVIILSAGMGTRMGKNIPKPLTEITKHKTIMDFQIEKLLTKVSLKDIFVVVGYNKDMIMKKFPNLNYIFNDQFRTANTSKSLLKGLKKIGDEDVLYLDGDTYFDREVLDLIDYNNSCCVVTKEKPIKNETKYNLNDIGFIKEISKSLVRYDGGVFAIRFIKSQDLIIFKKKLEEADDEESGDVILGKLCLTNKIQLRPIFLEEIFCKGINDKFDLKEVIDYVTKKSIRK